jgi:hypothetical protein
LDVRVLVDARALHREGADVGVLMRPESDVVGETRSFERAVTTLISIDVRQHAGYRSPKSIVRPLCTSVRQASMAAVASRSVKRTSGRPSTAIQLDFAERLRADADRLEPES